MSKPKNAIKEINEREKREVEDKIREAEGLKEKVSAIEEYLNLQVNE